MTTALKYSDLRIFAVLDPYFLNKVIWDMRSRIWLTDTNVSERPTVFTYLLEDRASYSRSP
jgi:hypothetical protein